VLVFLLCGNYSANLIILLRDPMYVLVHPLVMGRCPCVACVMLKLNYYLQSVGQSVLVSGTHLGSATNFSFSLKLSLDCCGFVNVAPSLARGRVCNFLLLLVLVSACPLRSEFRGTQDHILLSQFLTLNLKSKSHYCRQSVCQSILLSGAHLEPATNIPFSLRFSFRQLRFVIL
jgi:hypothetical protein